MSTEAALYAATGSARTVIGAKTAASPGIEETQVRSRPAGGHTACVTTGFWPWRTACGHHASDQTKICGSVPLPIQSRPKRDTTGRPKQRNEIAVYAARAAPLERFRASA